MARTMIGCARSDLRMLQLVLDESEVDKALVTSTTSFYVQQAIVKSLEAYLEWRDPSYRDRWTHDLRLVIPLVEEGHEGISDTTFDAVKESFPTLCHWYRHYREMLGDLIEQESIERLRELAIRLYDEVVLCLGPGSAKA